MSKSKTTSKVAFHKTLVLTTASTVATLPLQPTTWSERLTAIADAFQLYRLNKLKFRLYPSASQTGTAALGFYAGGSYLQPTAVGDICEQQYHSRMPPYLGMTQPADWQNLDKASLRGALPWYKTVDSSGVDDWEEDIGSLVVVSSVATDTVVVEIMGEYEFKEPMDPTSTGLEARNQRDARKRERLLRLLSMPSGTSPGIPSRSVGAVVRDGK
jgi:hypothetical protein